jgi:hypothetical protein
LRLIEFQIVLDEDETVENFEFPDSLLELTLASLLVTELLLKLPRYIEHINIHIDYHASSIPAIPVSMLPATLRTLDLTGINDLAPIVIDGPFPPRLEKWNALFDCNGLPPDCVLPSCIEEIYGGIQLVGTHFESVPKSLKVLVVDDVRIEALDVANFPSSLSSLYLGHATAEAFLMLPKNLSELYLTLSDDAMLTRAVCERLELLKVLYCSLHHFESIGHLNAFKCLKSLYIEARLSRDSLSQEALFSHLSTSSVDTIETINLTIANPQATQWPLCCINWKSVGT